MFRRATVLLTLLFLFASAQAQGSTALRIGVLVPATSRSEQGVDAALGAYAWRDARASSRGMNVEVVVQDGGVSALDTSRGIRELLSSGVHAILCCVTPESVAAVDDLDPEVPVLVLARPPNDVSSSRVLVMAPGPLPIARALTEDARRFGRGVGLMTLAGDYGLEREEAVRIGLIEAGLPLTEVQTFSAGARAVTPEALLVAASQPSAVIVWAPGTETARALEALRARGYEETVYLPWASARELPGGLRNPRLHDVLVAAPPIEVAGAEALRTEVAALREALDISFVGLEPTFEGALVFDALELLRAAAEVALVYGVDPAAGRAFSQALLDALVALPPRDGAAGSYDYTGRNNDLYLEEGLIIASVEAGRLVPVGSRPGNR